MRNVHFQTLLACGAAATLGACGGGDSSYVAALPPPPTTAPPPAECPPDCRPIPILPGVIESTTFATLGYESPSDPAGSPTGDGFSVSYDAASGFYTFDLPATGPAKVGEDDYGGEKLVDSAGNLRGYFTPTTSGDLSYSAMGYYTTGTNPGDHFGEIAFGVATPAAAVPITGTASYGVALSGSMGFGGGEMSFDFAKGTLSGYFDMYASGPYDNIDLGHFDFTNAVSAVGSGTFSGQLVNADLGTGTFEGLFTGPHAEELMGRYQMPLRNPDTGTLEPTFGVFVGKAAQ